MLDKSALPDFICSKLLCKKRKIKNIPKNCKCYIRIEKNSLPLKITNNYRLEFKKLINFIRNNKENSISGFRLG